MNVSPGEGRDTTGKGRACGPTRNNLLDGAGCVSYPSQPNAKVLTDTAGRLVSAWSLEGCEWCLRRFEQPPGGSEVLTCPRAVGPARGPNDRQEGGPTGTTEFVSGRGRGGRGVGGCAYRTLHYAAAMVRVAEIGRYSGSIPIRGVSA
jgi:hypothetical protein